MLLRPAVLRIAAVASGLVLLGVLGQCLGRPAAAQSKDDVARTPRGLLASSSPSASGAATSPPVALPALPPRNDAGVLGLDADASAREEAPEPLDLNAATEGELRRLPGIGPRRAAQILELRERLGGFRRIDDLVRIRGIGRAAMKRLRPLVRVGAPLRR
jgi:competence protein ComEA